MNCDVDLKIMITWKFTQNYIGIRFSRDSLTELNIALQRFSFNLVIKHNKLLFEKDRLRERLQIYTPDFGQDLHQLVYKSLKNNFSPDL
jgi:hypothetical protein